jgi:glyoxalase family protein
LWERDAAATGALLTDILGFARRGENAGWTRYDLGADRAGKLVDVKPVPGTPRGRWGTGGVHHVAYRVQDAAEQDALRSRLEAAGRRPTPVIDRFWFSSVYFREPGGVLFELATDGPGFERDA